MFGNSLDEEIRKQKEQDALERVEREAIRILWITGMIPVEEYRQLARLKLGIDYGTSASSALEIMHSGDLRTSFNGKTVRDQYIQSGIILASSANLDIASDDGVLSKMKEFQLLLLQERNMYDWLSGIFKQTHKRKQLLKSRFTRVSCDRVRYHRGPW